MNSTPHDKSVSQQIADTIKQSGDWRVRRAHTCAR